MKSATAFLPMSSAPIRSLVTADEKYSLSSSKLELKDWCNQKTASSTRSTLNMSRLDISFQCIEELFQHMEL